MKKIILILSFILIGLNAWSQKHSFGVGFSAYNFINDGYGYQFNQFSKVFSPIYGNSAIIYQLSNFHLFYEYKMDSLYRIKFSYNAFTREYRNPKAFLVDEIGLSGRFFSTTTLSISRNLISKRKNSLKLNGLLGLSYRNGDEFFHSGVFPPEYLNYTVRLQDVGYVLGTEARYNFHKNAFVNANLNFIDYVIGSSPKERVSIFNKSWTVFQANFSVGVNF
jgi:hypothetical protein